MKLYNWYYDKLSIGECFFYPRTKYGDDSITSLVFVYGNKFLKIDVVSHYKEKDYDKMLNPNLASNGAKEYLIAQIFNSVENKIVSFEE